MTMHTGISEHFEVSKIADIVIDNITLGIVKAKQKRDMNTLMKSYTLINCQQHFCDVDNHWHNEAFYIEDRMLSAFTLMIKAYAHLPLMNKYAVNHFANVIQHITNTHNDYSNNPKAIQAFSEAIAVKAIQFGLFQASCKHLTFGNTPNTLLVDKNNSDSFDYVASYITDELLKVLYLAVDATIQWSMYEYIYTTYTLNSIDSDYANDMQTVRSNANFYIENAIATIYQLRYYVSLSLHKHIEKHFLTVAYDTVYEKAVELNISYTATYNSVVDELSTYAIPNPTPTLYGEYAELAEASNYGFVTKLNIVDVIQQMKVMQNKLQRLHDYSSIAKEAIDNHVSRMYQQSVKENMLANNWLVYKAFHDCCIMLRAMLDKHIPSESDDE